MIAVTLTGKNVTGPSRIISGECVGGASATALPWLFSRSLGGALATLLFASNLCAGATMKPDFIVDAEGFGDFTTVQAAVESIPATNRDRMIVLVKEGTYHEKVRVDAPFVTLLGESRDGTRIEFSQLAEDFSANPDRLGRAVINLSETASDFVLENITVENTAGQIGPHAFTIYGKADRTVILDSDVLSHGADTVSLWRGDSGRYYHANCNFRGSVDFVCPRGWCYVTNCTFYEMKATAAVWHDGRVAKDMKFVLRDCRFDGTNGWNLARHHVDAQFYFLDCTFAETMRDQPPFRVIYPIGNKEATEADRERNAELDKQNRWGERAYFYNCRRKGGNYAWMSNNLSSAESRPTPEEITAAWAFADKWNPERTDSPKILSLSAEEGRITLVFSEDVTLKGEPRLMLRPDRPARYESGSGGNTLVFRCGAQPESVESLDLSQGTIIATEAGVTTRLADASLPARATNLN